MITEVAVLNVGDGRTKRFEAAFQDAVEIISAMPGFIDLELQRCLEEPSRYLLLVHWAQLEDHTEGFRASPAYERWSALLHHFYDPFPVVEHYDSVLRT